MKRLVIAEAAKADLAAIARYSEDRWGAARKRRYMEAIRRRIATLHRRPSLGRKREDIDRTCRSMIAGSHVLIYREFEDRIDLVRVLHQGMDLQARPIEG